MKHLCHFCYTSIGYLKHNINPNAAKWKCSVIVFNVWLKEHSINKDKNEYSKGKYIWPNFMRNCSPFTKACFAITWPCSCLKLRHNEIITNKWLSRTNIHYILTNELNAAATTEKNIILYFNCTWNVHKPNLKTGWPWIYLKPSIAFFCVVSMKI